MTPFFNNLLLIATLARDMSCNTEYCDLPGIVQYGDIRSISLSVFPQYYSVWSGITSWSTARPELSPGSSWAICL